MSDPRFQNGGDWDDVWATIAAVATGGEAELETFADVAETNTRVWSHDC